MKKLFLFFFILFSLTSFCQIDDTPFFIKLMETEFEAFRKKDPSLWIEFVDGNAVFTGADTAFKTKDQIIEEMKNAPDIFLSAAETYENIISRTYGNTAVLSCLTTFSFTSSDGNLVRIKFKFTRVHVKDSGLWKLVYHSAVPI
jgi:hypothetical protein